MARRGSRSPLAARSMPSCWTSCCPAPAASTCAAISAREASPRPSSCSPPEVRRRTRSLASSSAPTITSPSRSRCRSCSRGSRHCFGEVCQRPLAGLVRIGDLALNPARAEVTRAGQPVDLSAKEYRLLCYLTERRGELVTRDEALTEVWGYDAMPTTRTVDVHIAGLRQKLETHAAAPPLHPHRPRPRLQTRCPLTSQGCGNLWRFVGARGRFQARMPLAFRMRRCSGRTRRRRRRRSG